MSKYEPGLRDRLAEDFSFLKHHSDSINQAVLNQAALSENHWPYCFRISPRSVSRTPGDPMKQPDALQSLFDFWAATLVSEALLNRGNRIKFAGVFVDDPHNPHFHGFIKVHGADPRFTREKIISTFQDSVNRDSRFHQVQVRDELARSEGIWLNSDPSRNISYVTGHRDATWISGSSRSEVYRTSNASELEA